MKRPGLLASAALAALALAQPAHAFSTRVHVTIANDVRRTLIASGSNRVALKLSPHSAELAPDDVRAVVDHPLEFRAGAVGPDNIAFPGMTDPSHAVGQRPFEQCEALYRAAALPEERAYALGCFLHGATDAVAHHYVNYLSGETFTLTPVTSGREASFDNVVRHIAAEAMIQRAAFALDPDRFSAGELAHAVPKGFVLRTYFDETSPLYALMGARARAKLEAARAAAPGATLPELVTSAGLAPADHLVLSPVYLREIDAERQKLRATIVAAIAAMQDGATPEGAELGVGPGDDGALGTADDTTACTTGCVELFAKYKTYVALLAPRSDAGGNALPSAFDKLSDELRGDLFRFLPAYVDTIELLSVKLNEPLAQGQGGFDLSPDDLPRLLGPLDAWADDVTAVDYRTVAQAVLPDWLLELEAALNVVNVDLAAVLKTLLDPVVLPIKQAIEEYAIGEARRFVGALADELEAKQAGVEAEFEARLAAGSAPELGGTLLDDFFESGLYAHAFNAAAAAMAQRATVLPVGDDAVGFGPATFDASHTPSWMQLGACDYLRDAVFPLGMGVRGALSVKKGGTTYAAVIDDDSPVECHEGSLSAFAAAPTAASCALVSNDELVADPSHRGSVSRSYPPSLAGQPLACRNLVVAGLPGPPQGAAGGPAAGGAGGATGGGEAGANDASAGDDDDDGCSCRVAAPKRPGFAGWLGVGLGAVLVARRRRGRARRAASLASLALLALGASGCGGGGDGDEPADGAGGAGAAGVAGQGGMAGGGGAAGAAGEAGAGGGPGGAQTLINALGKSIWRGTFDRNGRSRAVELRFDAASLFWVEVVNPFGPGRRRTMRTMNVEADAKTVHTTVISPSTPDWPVDPDNGKKEDWSVELREGSPRKLVVARGGAVEEYEEGAWPAPTEGLTAVVRVFSPGSPTDEAFCNRGLASGPDRDVLWSFARGESGDPASATDIVAGAPLLTWADESGGNNFAVTDVPGFDRFGGTELDDQFNFIVLYTGTIAHPGGLFGMQEDDDDVSDALWAFVGPGVGGSNVDSDLFLEVHGHVPADITDDVVTRPFDAQDLPIEAMILRCTTSLEGQAVDLLVNLNGGEDDWKLVGEQPTKPLLDAKLFPPAL
jgi:hypothetical protein